MPKIIDGMPVDASTTNQALLGRTADDTATGILALANTDPASGSSVTNIQREFNAGASWVGRALNAVKNALPTFTNSQGLTATQSLYDRIEALSAKFHSLTGHGHSGSDGDGGIVSATAIANVALQGRVVQGTTLLAITGSSVDVSTAFAGKTASSGTLVKGVVVTAPYNKVIIRQGTAGGNEDDTYTDGSGNVVYGRLTVAGSVWTLSFYVNLGGTETAYTFASASDVKYFYQQLFNPIVDSPIYSEFASIPSENATQDVIDASATQRGVVSTGAQTFAGQKTFNNGIGVKGVFEGFMSTDSTTTGANQSIAAPTTMALKLTNASLTSIATITGVSTLRMFFLINGTGADLTIVDQYDGTINEIRTGTGQSLKIKTGAAVLIVRDTNASRWVVGGGAGGGGGAMTSTGSVQSLANAATITLTADQRQKVLIKGSSGAVTCVLPNGTVANQELFVQGTDDNNPVTIAAGSNVNSNGDTVYYNGTLRQYVWDATLTKWYQVGGL